jgi:hypothetical protein
MRSRTEANAAHWLLGTLAVLILVRLVAVSVYPATGFPDRFGYLNYASIIQSGREWLHETEGSDLETTTFRAVGFPMLLAGLQIVFRDNADLALQVLQTAATVLACAAAFAALARLAGPRGAAAATLGFGLSVTLAYELSILPDGLVIAAWVSIMSVALGRKLDGRGLDWRAACLVALLGCVLTLWRGNGLHLFLLLAPILVMAAWDGRRPAVARGIVLLILFAPSFVVHSGVSSWNEYRTGERFFTTGAQIALVQPVFRMARLGATPFEGEDPISRTYRTHAPDLLYEQIYDVNRALHSELGMSPNQIARANISLYLSTVAANPAIFARMAIENIDDKLAVGLLNPAFGLHEARQLVLGERLFPGFSKIVKHGEGGWTAIPYAVLYGVGLLVSVPLFLGAVVWAPLVAAWSLIRGSGDRASAAAVLATWLCCIAVIAYYAALFMELRYVVMLTPFLVALGWWSFFRRREG